MQKIDQTILKPGYRIIDERFFYIEPPKSIIPSVSADATDSAKWSVWRKRNYAFYEKELNQFPQSSLLIDIGAGQSHFAKLFEPFRVAAIDFYPYRQVNVIADINQEIPLHDGVADVTVLSNVLEHTKRPERMLNECFRILRSGGTLLLTVPFIIDVHQRPYDFFRYTDIALRSLLEERGFRDISVEPITDLFASYKQISGLFFTSLVDHTPHSFWGRFVLRVIWKMIRFGLWFGTPIFARTKPNNDFPLGYAVKARR